MYSLYSLVVYPFQIFSMHPSSYQISIIATFAFTSLFYISHRWHSLMYMIQRLVEQTETHVVVRLLSSLLLLLLSSSLGTTGSSRARSSSTRSTASWNRRQLLVTLGNQLLHALTVNLSQQFVDLLVLHLDGDRLQHLLDVGGRWGGVTGVDQQ